MAIMESTINVVFRGEKFPLNRKKALSIGLFKDVIEICNDADGDTLNIPIPDDKSDWIVYYNYITSKFVKRYSGNVCIQIIEFAHYVNDIKTIQAVEKMFYNINDEGEYNKWIESLGPDHHLNDNLCYPHGDYYKRRILRLQDSGDFPPELKDGLLKVEIDYWVEVNCKMAVREWLKGRPINDESGFNIFRHRRAYTHAINTDKKEILEILDGHYRNNARFMQDMVVVAVQHNEILTVKHILNKGYRYPLEKFCVELRNEFSGYLTSSQSDEFKLSEMNMVLIDSYSDNSGYIAMRFSMDCTYPGIYQKKIPALTQIITKGVSVYTRDAIFASSTFPELLSFSQWLLELGLTNAGMLSACIQAIERKNIELIKIIVKTPSKYPHEDILVEKAAECSSRYDILLWLVTNGAFVNSKVLSTVYDIKTLELINEYTDEQGRNYALKHAAFDGLLDKVKWLVQKNSPKKEVIEDAIEMAKLGDRHWIALWLESSGI